MPPPAPHPKGTEDRDVLKWLATLNLDDYQFNLANRGFNARGTVIDCIPRKAGEPRVRLSLDHNRWLRAFEVINTDDSWRHVAYFEEKEQPALYKKGGRPGWAAAKNFSSAGKGNMIDTNPGTGNWPQDGYLGTGGQSSSPVPVHKDGVSDLLFDPAANELSAMTAEELHQYFVLPVGKVRDGASKAEVKAHNARLNTQLTVDSILGRFDRFLEEQNVTLAGAMQRLSTFAQYRDDFAAAYPGAVLTPFNTLRHGGFTLQAQDALMGMLRPGITDPLAPDWTPAEKQKLAVAADFDEYLDDKGTSFKSLLAKKQTDERAAAIEFLGYQHGILSLAKGGTNTYLKAVLSLLRTTHFPHELEAEFQGLLDNWHYDPALKNKGGGSTIVTWKNSLTKIFDYLLEQGISGDDFKLDLKEYDILKTYKPGDNLVHDLKLAALKNKDEKNKDEKDKKDMNAGSALDEITAYVLDWLAKRTQA